MNLIMTQKYSSNFDGTFSIAVRVEEWYFYDISCISHWLNQHIAMWLKNYPFHYYISVVGFE